MKEPRECLEAALSAVQISALDDAGVGEYLEGVLGDADAEDDDLSATIAPMLVDVGAAEDEEAADKLCAAILDARRGAGGDKGAASAPEPAAKLLSAPVSMFALVAEDEKGDAAAAAKFVPKAMVNFNTTMTPPVNSLIEDDESEEAMARRFKQQKRGEKQLKRSARREKVLAMQRDDFMKELTREPVVLHWRGGGGGSSDILLKDVSMDINGLLLLDSCDLTLVTGRKYGLVGRNGIGKTTMLKFLAAHRFEGIPSNLQILHIEQEVPSGERSVLDTVLATDIERSALLEEEKELLAEGENEDVPPPLPTPPPLVTPPEGGWSEEQLAKANANLLKAAREDEAKRVDDAIAKGALVTHANDKGHTAAHMAAAFGALTVLRLLHARGADFGLKNEGGMTPLEAAVHIGEHEAARHIEALLAGRPPPKREKTEDDERDEAERQSRLVEIMDRLTEIDAESAPARAASILAGLGFDTEMQAQPTASFSGGWRMRVALARALFIAPDVLLLDEPTNHLDLHAVLWLETYLQGWGKTLVVVSHARSFLNNVCTDMLHFINKSVTRYKGDYDHFETTRAEALRNNERMRESQEKTRAHMQAFVDRFRSNASRASMVQSRIKALGRMECVAEILDDPSLRFAFPAPEPLSAPVLQLVDVSFGYPEKPELFSKVNLGLDMESRVALVGPNGIGKSTLLKVILGDLEASSGNVSRSSRLRLGRFSQHHVDQLDLELTALESFQKEYPSVKPLEIRAHLGGMGLGGNTALQKMSTLSGGQKSRVAFAQIMWQKPHLLLLDEPTNHLDLDAVEALIHSLINFEGGVLVISHDEHLVQSICEELWVASPGRVSIFKDSFEEYRRRQLKLTKRGVLPPMRPLSKAVDVTDDVEEAASTSTPAAKPKAKIEIMPAGKKRGT